MISRQHFLAALTTVCLSVPALTPYFLVPDIQMQVDVIAALAVINAAAAFACCAVAESIALARLNRETQQPISLAVASIIFACGAAVCVYAPKFLGVGDPSWVGLVFCLSSLLIAISEGLSKAVGNFKNHQLGLVLSGIAFPLPFFLLEATSAATYLVYFGVVRGLTVLIVFPFVIRAAVAGPPLGLRYAMSVRPDQITILSLAGYGYGLLERLLISRIGVSFAGPLEGKFFLATYQSMGVLLGVRGQLVNSKIYLMANGPRAFSDAVAKILVPLFLATPLLAMLGALILTKGMVPPFAVDAMWSTLGLLVCASMVDLLAAWRGVLLTYCGKIWVNVKAEVIGLTCVGLALLFNESIVIAACLILGARLAQLCLKKRAIR